jgi:NAD-dependent deacetylase
VELLIEENTCLCVLTGAGVSEESGVQTFRGQGGLWEGMLIEHIASPKGFERMPALLWRFYGKRRRMAKTVQPNAGHHALVEWEQRLGDRFLLITQNVDGLHQRAGSKRIIPLHGHLMESRCSKCQRVFWDENSYMGEGEELPRCEECEGLLRPNVVWFGEMLDKQHLDHISSFMQRAGERLAFVAAGTSGQVYPAAGLVDEVRRKRGRSWLIDVAPSEFYANRFDHVLRGKSGEVFPKLWPKPT